MGHVEDRWYKAVKGADGKPRRVKSARYGRGMRYRARCEGPDGRERSEFWGVVDSHCWSSLVHLRRPGDALTPWRA
nr:hypothetical protein GCM10020092_088160 [Actinoplanes digitatis]